MLSPTLSRIVSRGFGPAVVRRVGLVTLVAGVAGGTLPALADDLGAMAKRLAELRGEVESLSDDLSARKNDLQPELVQLLLERSVGREVPSHGRSVLLRTAQALTPGAPYTWVKAMRASCT